MKSAYFKELQQYEINQISSLLDLTPEAARDVLKRLKAQGVVRTKDLSLQSDELEIDEEVADLSDFNESPDGRYSFKYVGVIVIDDCILKIYPKYFGNETSPLKHLQLILRVIKKYNDKGNRLRIANTDDSESPFNMLNIVLFIVNDYIENGVYTNYKDIIEVNGEGEIAWDRTVDDIDPYIIKSTPFYLELYTNNSMDDDSDYFRRLHTCITATCIDLLRETELDELFSITAEVSYEGSLDDLGDPEYILYRLRREMNVQFITRKQMLLRTMYAFIAQQSSTYKSFGLSMYGTSSFHQVWEDVCATVFGNDLKIKLSQLALPTPLSPPYRTDQTLLDLIEKPKWDAYIEPDRITHCVGDTLRPDIIRIYEREDAHCFGIFDAKYYNISFDESGVSGQPGVRDITKQYIYQLAYKDFISVHGFSSIINAFLMPHSGNTPIICGEARLDMLHTLAVEPFLRNILVVKLPAAEMYNWYLRQAVINISEEIGLLEYWHDPSAVVLSE